VGNKRVFNAGSWVNSKSEPYHIRGMTRVVRSLVCDSLTILLPCHDGLVRNFIWGNIFTLCPPTLPHVLEKLEHRGILARVGRASPRRSHGFSEKDGAKNMQKWTIIPITDPTEKN